MNPVISLLAYASRTGTRVNLSQLRLAGWRLMVSARGVLRTEGFRYALDNGAWTSFQEFLKGLRVTPDPCLRSFVKAVDKLGGGADFIVIPDIVQGGARSWALTRYWLRRLRRDRRLRGVKLLIAVQDGFDPWAVGRFMSSRVGIFVGGSTEYKEASMGLWARVAHSKGAICHVGRVNTARRIAICGEAEVDSFDGSSASRYVKTLWPLESARWVATLHRAQGDLFQGERELHNV